MTIYLEERLQERAAEGILRRLTRHAPSIDFSSNDSLGLARSSWMKHSVLEEWQQHSSSFSGFGSTGSRLLTGNHSYSEDLEQMIASFHGYATGTLFNSGYMANLGVLSAVGEANDVILFDHAVHASMHAGLKMSRAISLSFRHNCLEHLEDKLKKLQHMRQRLICIESVYSTDGSVAPLKEICFLAEKYHASLIVDEAHATGVLGPQGKGLIAEQYLQPLVLAHIVTFGKALGVQGAIVLSDSILQQTLVNFAPSYIYTTALPWISIAAIRASYRLFPYMDKERAHLHMLIDYCSKMLQTGSSTHIHALVASGNAAVDRIANSCQSKGYDVRPLKRPTVRRGQESLRLCLHSFNTLDELRGLINCLKTEQEILS